MMNLTDMPDMLTVREVAEFLRVTPRAVYEYIDNGALPKCQLITAAGHPMRRLWVPNSALIDLMGGTNE